MKSHQPHQVPSDLLCWRFGSATHHQSLFRPKEPQLTSDPSPLLPLRKVGAPRLGEWQLSIGEGIWRWRGLGCGGGCSGSKTFEMWRGGEGRVGVVGGWNERGQVFFVCVKSPNCAPQHSPKSPFTTPHLKYLQTNEHHCHMSVYLLIRWCLESSCSDSKAHLGATLQALAILPNSLYLLQPAATWDAVLFFSYYLWGDLLWSFKHM